MTEPLNLPELDEQAVDAAHEEPQPFLHSVTSKTPWCLFSALIHVFVIALIGLVPLVLNEIDRTEAPAQFVLIDSGLSQSQNIKVVSNENNGLEPAMKDLPPETEPTHPDARTNLHENLRASLRHDSLKSHLLLLNNFPDYIRRSFNEQFFTQSTVVGCFMHAFVNRCCNIESNKPSEVRP